MSVNYWFCIQHRILYRYKIFLLHLCENVISSKKRSSPARWWFACVLHVANFFLTPQHTCLVIDCSAVFHEWQIFNLSSSKGVEGIQTRNKKSPGSGKLMTRLGNAQIKLGIELGFLNLSILVDVLIRVNIKEIQTKKN